MGLHTVVVDGNPDSPGFQLADDFGVVSTRDIEALKKFADDYLQRGGHIDGVSVMGSDIPQFVAQLAAHLQLPHIPLEAARLSTDKLAMKECFQAKGVPIPWFQAIQTVEELSAIIETRGYPLILKPVDRSGARGVFQLHPNCDYKALFQQSQQESSSGQLMVEEYLAGPQISTESIMHQGRAHTPGFADRNYEHLERFAPHIIENGGWEPSRVSAEQRAAVEALVQQAALALGVTDGVVKGDIVYTEEGPKIIEMATRLSGGDFSESLVPLGSGINYVETALQIALGQTPQLDLLRPKFATAVANRYFFPAAGKLLSIEGIEEVRQQDFVKKLEIWYAVGDTVPDVSSHAHRFGVFIVVADDLDRLEERVRWVYETVQIEIESSTEPPHAS